MDRLIGQQRRSPFRHRRFRHMRPASVLEPERIEAHQPRRLDLGVEIGELVGDALEGGKRLAEGVALADIGPGLVQRLPRRAEALQANERAREIEALHHLDKALALLAQQVRRRHPDIVEEDRTAADRVLAEIGKPRGRDPGRVHRHEDRRDAAGAVLGLAGAGKDHRALRLIGGRDRGLLAVQHVMVAHPLHLQPEVRRIRAAARLGQRDRQHQLARGQLRQPVAPDLVIAETREDLPVQRGKDVDVAHVEIGTGDFLDDHARIDRAGAEPTQLLGQFRRDQAKAAHLAQDVGAEGAGGLARLVAGGEFLAGELARHLAQRAQFLGVEDRGVHRFPPQAWDGSGPLRPDPPARALPRGARRVVTCRTCGSRACASRGRRRRLPCSRRYRNRG